MSFDMSQFYQVFFEEAQEHLSSLESLLLALQLDDPDPEALNAIFRAAHSIKGSSGTFGFTDLTEVTHELETLLDRVRKGELALNAEMVDASLAAGDVLRNLLAAHQGQEQADRDAARQITERLGRLAHGQPPPWRIVCRLSGGADAWERLLTELARYGELQVDAPPQDEQPCQLRLVSAIDEAMLRELLDFVTEAESLTLWREVEAVDEDAGYGFFEPLPAVAAQDDAPAEHPEVDPGYGFFEPLSAAAGTAGAVPAAQPVDEAADGSWGLFPAAQGATAAPVPAVSQPTSAAPRANTPAPARDAASIRVSVEKVDQMINLVGELVITQAMLAQAAAALDPVAHERLLGGIAQLERNTRDLQESVMSVRMLPISAVFSRFPRVVRDLSAKLGKQVQLTLQGEHTELDKGLIERITDPLTHLVRNSLDHGIEAPELRRAAGKTEQGNITLRAYHQSGHIVIEVADDGAGLRRERILAKARERGLAVSDSMSDAEVWLLIFEPGFSTAEAVTEVSGRGVGMDVVKRNIAALGGRIELDSMPGVGTRVTVRLPLTLAILDGMSIGVAEETYIVPLDYVVESLQATPPMIKRLAGQPCLLQVRGEYLPVVSLREAFGIHGPAPALHEGIMVVVAGEGGRAALLCDQLVGQQQVVIKSLEANYRRVPGVAGATIMGDGRVALILDVAGLIALTRRALAVAA